MTLVDAGKIWVATGETIWAIAKKISTNKEKKDVDNSAGDSKIDPSSARTRCDSVCIRGTDQRAGSVDIFNGNNKYSPVSFSARIVQEPLPVGSHQSTRRGRVIPTDTDNNAR